MQEAGGVMVRGQSLESLRPPCIVRSQDQLTQVGRYQGAVLVDPEWERQ
ncbi:MAG TPA: hypothetical protein V6D07_11445 [Trichocoleus sp.]